MFCVRYLQHSSIRTGRTGTADLSYMLRLNEILRFCYVVNLGYIQYINGERQTQFLSHATSKLHTLFIEWLIFLMKKLYLSLSIPYHLSSILLAYEFYGKLQEKTFN